MAFPVRATALVEHIRQVIPEVLAVYAYGSRVRQEQHPASDLDLALLLPGGARISPLVLAQLRGDLESAAGIEVDVSILSITTQIVHCKEVVTNGQRIFVSDPQAVDEFEMYTLSGYARLCEDRVPVLRAYTGVPHG